MSGELDQREYLPRIESEPVTYFAYGLLTRFHAMVYDLWNFAEANSDTLSSVSGTDGRVAENVDAVKTDSSLSPIPLRYEQRNSLFRFLFLF